MRADVYLTLRGSVETRAQAKRLIESGQVRIDGREVTKCAAEIDDQMAHTVEILARERYVSRGGCKLEAALCTFGIDPRGLTALDIGASTGGFTDCLLQHGAACVYAVEGGEGQLHPRLRQDSRVKSIEKCNARYLDAAKLGPDFSPVPLAVMDVSFISQTLILPVLLPLLTDEGRVISLIKPQFEAGRAAIGKGGVVKSAADREAAVFRVIDFAAALGLYCTHIGVSPLRGGDGNIEYLACFARKPGDAPLPDRQALRLAMRENHQ